MSEVTWERWTNLGRATVLAMVAVSVRLRVYTRMRPPVVRPILGGASWGRSPMCSVRAALMYARNECSYVHIMK